MQYGEQCGHCQNVTHTESYLELRRPRSFDLCAGGISAIACLQIKSHNINDECQQKQPVSCKALLTISREGRCMTTGRRVQAGRLC